MRHRFLGPVSQGLGVLGPWFWNLGSWVLGSRISGSQALILDYAIMDYAICF